MNNLPAEHPALEECLDDMKDLSIDANQQPQPGQPGRPMQFHEFFTAALDSWLAQLQLTLDPPRVDGKEVELHKLFLMVGALGGCRAVSEKKLWPVVGAKIGFPYFNGPPPYSKPEVADQLSEIYQKILADFEVHWHNSLRPRDPTSIFPLPPQLQYLHPEIERLATAQLPIQQQQPQPVPGLTNLPPMLQQPFADPDILKLSPEDLKRRGLSDELIQKVLVYRQHVAAKSTQTRKEQELLLQQQRQIQAEQATNLLNTQKETPQLAPGSPPSPGLGGPQTGLGANALQTSAPVQPPQLPSSVPLLPGLNVPQDQLRKAQEKVRAAIGLLYNNRDYSSIDVSHEQGILLEQSILHTQSLLKQVAQNLVSFAVLAPDDESELNQVAQTVVILADQAQILQKPPPEKRFILSLGDLNNYRNHLTTFLMRVKGLQGQAIALQNQQNSGPLPSVPPPVAQQEPAPTTL